MNSYQRYSYNQYLERNSSEYIQAAIMYSGQYTSSLHKLIKIISEGLITVLIISFLAWTEWIIVMLFTVFLGILIISYDKFFRKNLKFAGEMQNRYNIIAIRGHTGRYIRVQGNKSTWKRKVLRGIG